MHIPLYVIKPKGESPRAAGSLRRRRRLTEADWSGAITVYAAYSCALLLDSIWLTDLELLENSSPYSSPFPSSKVLLQLLLRGDYMEMKKCGWYESKTVADVVFWGQEISDFRLFRAVGSSWLDESVDSVLKAFDFDQGCRFLFTSSRVPDERQSQVLLSQVKGFSSRLLLHPSTSKARNARLACPYLANLEILKILEI